MSEGDHGLHHAVAPGVTRDETRNTFDEDRLTFGEAGSSQAVAQHGALARVPPAQEARAADAHRSGGTQTGHQTDRAGAQPSPLSVLCTANEVADAIKAGSL